MIKINDNWYIDYDQYAYILRETYVGKEKGTGKDKEQTKTHGYFRSIGFALKKYAELNIENKGTIEEWLDKYEKITKQLLEIGEK